MKKQNIHKFLYFISILLIIGFVIRLGVDFFKYNTHLNSAPFYVFVIARIVEFLVPSIIIYVVAKVFRKKYAERPQEMAQALKLAKKYIKNKPMPSALEDEFKRNGLGALLEGVYLRTAELIQDNQDVSKATMQHMEQILPSIAFYEALLQKEESQEKALELFEKWCFVKIEKMAKWIPIIMKIPGLYKKTPNIMAFMLNAIFGHAAGFEFKEKECENGFAVDMLKCPYMETCKKYGCPELTQFFCKADDLCYGNMHPRLVWGRTKTLGMGGDCCDFKLSIK